MKKILLFAVVVAAGAAMVYAQKPSTIPMKFGVRAGLNSASITEKGNGATAETKSRAGLHAGVAVEQGLGRDWFVESGLYYSCKGGISAASNTGDYTAPKITLSLHYVQVPLMAGYRYVSSPKWAFTFAFGGYAGYAFKGNMKAMGLKYDVLSNSDYLKYNDGASTYVTKVKHLDAGVRFAIAAELNSRYYFGLGGEFGLRNLNASTVNGMTATATDKTNCGTFTVGYNF